MNFFCYSVPKVYNGFKGEVLYTFGENSQINGNKNLLKIETPGKARKGALQTKEK